MIQFEATALSSPHLRDGARRFRARILRPIGSIKLDYLSAGVIAWCDPHPNFFVLRKEAAGWEEWKTEMVVRLAQKNPNRYRLDAEGRWCCPPGENTRPNRAVLRCAVLSGDQLDFSTKSPIPEDYFRSEASPVSDDALERVLALVTRRQVCRWRASSEPPRYGYTG